MDRVSQVNWRKKREQCTFIENDFEGAAPKGEGAGTRKVVVVVEGSLG